MAPIRDLQLRPRHLDSNKIFPITFGVVASLIIAGAIFWACIWPCIRVRFINDRFPSRTRFRDEYNVLHPMRGRLKSMAFWRKRLPSPSFPSHPAVLHDDSSRLLTPRLPVHSLRFESPSLVQTRTAEDIRLPTLRPRTRSTTHLERVSLSNCFVTPPRKSLVSRKGWNVEKSITMPRTRTEYDRARSIASDHKFGDAKEYILALPEPLILRTHSPVPTPVQDTRPIDTDALSESLSRPSIRNTSYITNNPHSSSINETSLGEIDSTVTDSYDEEISEVSTFSEEKDEDDVSENNSNTRDQSIADLSEPGSERPGPSRLSQHQNITVLHRLKTYRSLTGALSIQPLTRAGTLTRPKTPVAEIRKLYTRNGSDADDTSGNISGADTLSTKPWTATDGSMTLSSTAQTSIDATASSSSLLPTPLQVRSPLDQTFKLKMQNLDNHNSNNASPPDLATKLKSLGLKKQLSDLTSRQKDDLAANIHSSSHLLKLTSHIPVAVRKSRLVRPVNLLKEVRDAMLDERNRSVSSIYSRDTRGLSILRDQPSPATGPNGFQNLECPISDTVPTQVNSDEQAPPTADAPGYPAKLDTAVSREVEHWRIPSQVEAMKASSFSSLEQTLSRKDRRYSSLHEVMVDEASSEVSAISTELNSVEAEAIRNSLPRLCIRESNGGKVRSTSDESIEAVPVKMRIRANSDSTIGLNERGNAPGGAQWI